jgi:hypothetical protein
MKVKIQEMWKEDFDWIQLANCTSVYQKVSGLVSLSEKCKSHSSLPLGAVVSLFRESV